MNDEIRMTKKLYFSKKISFIICNLELIHTFAPNKNN